jgi:hypothetical protein
MEMVHPLCAVCCKTEGGVHDKKCIYGPIGYWTYWHKIRVENSKTGKTKPQFLVRIRDVDGEDIFPARHYDEASRLLFDIARDRAIRGLTIRSDLNYGPPMRICQDTDLTHKEIVDQTIELLATDPQDRNAKNVYYITRIPAGQKK